MSEEFKDKEIDNKILKGLENTSKIFDTIGIYRVHELDADELIKRLEQFKLQSTMSEIIKNSAITMPIATDETVKKAIKKNNDLFMIITDVFGLSSFAEEELKDIIKMHKDLREIIEYNEESSPLLRQIIVDSETKYLNELIRCAKNRKSMLLKISMNNHQNEENISSIVKKIGTHPQGE